MLRERTADSAVAPLTHGKHSHWTAVLMSKAASARSARTLGPHRVVDGHEQRCSGRHDEAGLAHDCAGAAVLHKLPDGLVLQQESAASARARKGVAAKNGSATTCNTNGRARSRSSSTARLHARPSPPGGGFCSASAAAGLTMYARVGLPVCAFTTNDRTVASRSTTCEAPAAINSVRACTRTGGRRAVQRCAHLDGLVPLVPADGQRGDGRHLHHILCCFQIRQPAAPQPLKDAAPRLAGCAPLQSVSIDGVDERWDAGAHEGSERGLQAQARATDCSPSPWKLYRGTAGVVAALVALVVATGCALNCESRSLLRSASGSKTRALKTIVRAHRSAIP